MLGFYQNVAVKLRPFQPFFFILALVSLCWLGYLLLLAPAGISQRWQLTALVSFAFLLNVLLLPLLFAVQEPPAKAGDFWSRLRTRLRCIMQYCLAWLVTVLFLIILWLFLRIAMGIIAPLLF